MRGMRSFLALLVVAAGLGAYIYFVESKRPPSSQPEAKPKVFEGLEAEKVEEITVALHDGDRTTVKKSGNDWQMVAPLQTQADQTEASGLATNLATLERQHVVDENPPDLKDFGLAPPRVEVAFRTSGSQEPKRLLIGAKTATGGDLYAKMPSESRVFLISGYLDSTFNRSTFDLRDKAALKFDRDKADALDISAGGRTVSVRKDGSEWRLVAPQRVRADFGSIEGLLGRLSSAQMKSIVTPGPTPPSDADLKKYGLAKPTATVRVGAGSAQATLAFGGDAGNGAVYARDLARPAVFTIESSNVDELKKDPAEFRRKDLFEFRPFNAKRVEATRDGQTAVYEQVGTTDPKAPATVKWVQTTPAKKDVDQAKMDAVLSAFSNLRAQSFAPSTSGTGVESPALTLVVRYDDGKSEERVAFGVRGEAVHASRAGEPGAAKIDKADYDNAIKALSEIK